MADDERQDAPKDEQAPEETPEQAAETPVADDSAPEQLEADSESGTTEQPEAAQEPEPKPKRERKKDAAAEPEVIPGAHLEPDLVLEDEARGGERLGELASAEVQAAEQALAGDQEQPAETAEEDAPAPVATTILELAADARYHATGKRKSAVARVILKPGTGEYAVNGRTLDQYFPRTTLQTQVRQALETVGQQDRMDVVAKIHGGGVSAQADALRHGITRALVDADPNLRGELKRRGFLTRDPRVKERKKAGLKKARKRPQFSKR